MARGKVGLIRLMAVLTALFAAVRAGDRGAARAGRGGLLAGAVLAVAGLAVVLALTVVQAEDSPATGLGSPTDCLNDNVTGTIDGGGGDLVSVPAGAGNVISMICIKTGAAIFPLAGTGDCANVETDPGPPPRSPHSECITANGQYADGPCYAVSGMGTAKVTVTRKPATCPSGSGISHVDFLEESTVTETATATNTETATATNTETATATNTETATATNTETATATNTETATATNTETATATNTETATATNTETATATNTVTATATPEDPKSTQFDCIAGKLNLTPVTCKFDQGEELTVGGTADFGQDMNGDTIAGWQQGIISVTWPPGLDPQKNSDIVCPPGSVPMGKVPGPGAWEDGCVGPSAGPIVFDVTLNCTDVGTFTVNVLTDFTREDGTDVPPEKAINNQASVDVTCNAPTDEQINIHVNTKGTGSKLEGTCWGVFYEDPVLGKVVHDVVGDNTGGVKPDCGEPSNLKLFDKDPAPGLLSITITSAQRVQLGNIWHVQMSFSPVGQLDGNDYVCDLSLGKCTVPKIAVGGIFTDLVPGGSSGGSAGLLAGVIAGATAAAMALVGAAWYARRRSPK